MRQVWGSRAASGPHTDHSAKFDLHVPCNLFTVFIGGCPSCTPLGVVARFYGGWKGASRPVQAGPFDRETLEQK